MESILRKNEMDELIDLLNSTYECKIEPLQRENENLKRDIERYRKIAQKAVMERNALQNLCRKVGVTE